MSQHEDYLALSKGARMHLKQTPDNQFYFRTSLQVKWFIWGAIGLVCLPAPLLMSVVLDGSEQVFHLGSSIFLVFFVLFAMGVRQHLILDAASGKLKLEKSWWGFGKSIKSEWPLSSQRAVVAPIAEIREGCLLEIADQKYTIGSADESRQMAIFLQKHLRVPAFDRVSQWPKELEIHPQRKAEPVLEASEIDRHPERKTDPGSSSAERTDEPDSAGSDRQYLSIMDHRIFLKLALPFPVFLIIGVILSMLANQGGA